MELKVVEYIAYVSVSILLTTWVATTLFRHGRQFLVDVFDGDEALANSVNHLLVVGFYLVNLGYITLQLKLADEPTSPAQIIEALAGKVGLVLLVLGVMHFGNLFVFAKMRQRSHEARINRPPLPNRPSPLPPAPPGYGASPDLPQPQVPA